MEKHGRQLHVRMSDAELDRAKRLAQASGMTTSELVRALTQMPPQGAAGGAVPLVVVDRLTAVKLMREMRRWGHHYNQAVHALNAIAYYLRLDEADAADAREVLSDVAERIEEMDGGVALLRSEVAAIAEAPRAYL